METGYEFELINEKSEVSVKFKSITENGYEVLENEGDK